MSTPWIFSPQLPTSAPSTCTVDADEARHAAGSRRLRSGDRVQLFNGKGVVADASLGSANPDGSIEVAIDSLRVMPAISPTIEIATAVAKGDRLTTMLESIGPLAVSRWTPLNCAHSVVKWSPAHQPRAQRVLIASCKQSRQPFLPVIAAECSVESAVRDANQRGAQVFVAHRGGQSIASVRPIASLVAILIGPEGGFTDEEISAAQSIGARSVSLGDAILRIELAAVCAVASMRVG